MPKKKTAKVILLCITFFICLCAEAGVERPVSIPLLIDTEDKVIKVDACLLVKEYSFDKKWSEFVEQESSPIANPLKKVIAAIVGKNKKMLFELSNVKYGRDTKKFQRQAGAFFEQLERLELYSVLKAYELDDLIVFFLQFKYNDRTFVAPFIFKYQENSKLGFLPYRTDLNTYLFVEKWFFNSLNEKKQFVPEYCKESLIKKYNYKVRLVLDSDEHKINSPSVLYLQGYSFDNPIKDYEQQVKEINDFFLKLDSLLENKKLDSYTKLFTLEGGNRLKEWLSQAGDEELSMYKKSVMHQRPFFVFNLGSILVVYTKSELGVRVTYLLNSNNRLLWVNASHVTLIDSVFKKGVLMNSAKEAKPFFKFK